MKYILGTILLLFAFSSFGQKANKNKNTKYNKVALTILTSEYGSVKTKNPNYDIVFPAKNIKGIFIKTAEGKKLKMGSELDITFQDSSQQPTAQNGVISAGQTVTHSNGGRTVSITTSTTVNNGDGTKTTTSTTKTFESDGTSTTTATTSTESLGDGNTIVIITDN